MTQDSGLVKRIGAIGPGAMGCLLGGLLALDGHEVWLFCRQSEDAALLEAQGIVIEQGDNTLEAHVRATASAGDAAPLDMLLVMVKSFATARAIATAAPALGPDSLVLTLQNGLGNAELIAEAIGASRVLAGVTSQGATLLGPGRVRHAGSGPTTLADLSGGATERAHSVAGLLTRAGIAASVAADHAPLVWGKLVVSSALNALTALTGRLNGEILEESNCLALAEDLVRETARVAVAAGIALPFEDPAAELRVIALATRPNRSSMLQDFEYHRPTEVGAINEAITAVARKHGVEAPRNETVARLVRERESRYRRVERGP